MSDLSHWDIATDFTAVEAAALAMGFDPAQPGYVLDKSNPLYELMKRHYDAAKQAIQQCDDPQFVEDIEELRSVDLEWITTNEDPEDGAYLPRWLGDIKLSGFEAQQFTRKEIIRWLTAIGFKSRYQFKTDSNAFSEMEKPIGAKERASLLRLVIGMAIDGYGYDPTAAKSPIPLEIANRLALLKMPMDDDTVRKYFTEANKSVLPKNFKLP